MLCVSFLKLLNCGTAAQEESVPVLSLTTCPPRWRESGEAPYPQLTTLQEVIARWLGVDCGGYHQVIDSFRLHESSEGAAAILNPRISQFLQSLDERPRLLHDPLLPRPEQRHLAILALEVLELPLPQPGGLPVREGEHHPDLEHGFRRVG